MDGPGATITLNRPDRANALDLEDLRALETALVDLRGTPGLRSLVLTGAGRHFCSGVNIQAVAPDHDWRDNPIGRVADLIDAFEVPTLCAFNGGVFGGGVDLALACDFRLGVAGMKCFAPPARLGIQYPGGGLERAATRLGPGGAKRLFLAVETLDDAELLRLGFLDWLVPAEQIAARAAQWAATVNALAPLAVRGMKRTINEALAGRLDRAAADARFVAGFESADYQEGRRAMAEKRAPVFGGE